MANNEDIGKIIDEETKKRLEIMQDDNYQWPERVDSKDYMLIIVLIVICILLIVGCMLGVIE